MYFDSNWRSFRIRPENLNSVVNMLQREGIPFELGERRRYDYYMCCPSCEEYPLIVREMQEIFLPSNISGNRFHSLLVNERVTPPTNQHIFLNAYLYHNY